MIVIRNRDEAKREASSFPSAVRDSIDIDIKIIEDCYTSQSEEYGPLIIVIDEDEEDKMIEKYPIIKSLEPEEFYTIYEDENTLIERTCYILTDAGFIVYYKRKK